MQLLRSFYQQIPDNNQMSSFNGVDLKTFFVNNAPDYVPVYCKVEQFDCKSYWKKVWNINIRIFNQNIILIETDI